MRALLSDHDVVFYKNVTLNEPLFCSICGGSVCLDGYPERTDGKWIHVRDRQAKNKTLREELLEVINDPRLRIPSTEGVELEDLPDWLAPHDAAIEIGVIRALVEKYKDGS